MLRTGARTVPRTTPVSDLPRRKACVTGTKTRKLRRRAPRVGAIHLFVTAARMSHVARLLLEPRCAHTHGGHRYGASPS